jgi:hypothetical protein
VLYKQFLEQDYFVLALSKKEVHLFKGRGKELKEMKDAHFPAFYREEYEYSRPARGSSYSSSLKSFEKDKSILQSTRLRSFYRALDRELDGYLDGIPLVIAGAGKDTSHFEKETHHARNIIGTLQGNYNLKFRTQLPVRAWETVRSHRSDEQEKILLTLRELRGRGLVSMGVQEVWKEAKMGKAHVLVVEKDYRRPAFLGSNEFRLLLRPPRGSHTVLNDAVDDIIKTVLEKNGEVVFTDADRLEAFDHVALIKRYRDQPS